MCDCRKELGAYLAAIDKVDVKDIKTAVAAMLKTPPTVAVVGNISAVPRYDAIAKRFN